MTGSAPPQRSVLPGSEGGGNPNFYYYLFVAVPLMVLGIFYFYPLSKVAIIAFTEPKPGLGNFAEMVSSTMVRNVLVTTLRICLLTSVVSILLAYLVAYVMLHVSDQRQTVMLFCVILTFWISVLVRAFAWITLLHQQGLVNTALTATGLVSQPLALVRNEFGVILGMVHYLVPYAVLPLYANLRGIDRRLVPAARNLGATPAQAFLKVYLPLSTPGILGAFILVLVFSLGFYITPAVLGGGRVMMMAEYISVNVVETLRWGLASALAVSMLIIVFGLIVLMNRIIGFNQLYAVK
jgi:putative spermidine/putrescine transport system permease protein